jgi:hypothetical protein
MSGISPSKRRILEKKRERKKRKREKEKKEQGLKSKSGETIYEEAPCFQQRKEKKRMKFTSSKRFYRMKERKDITFSYSAKSDVWPHPYPHIIYICTTFYSLTFSFLTPIHPSTMIIWHINSLEFSFAFIIYKV